MKEKRREGGIENSSRNFNNSNNNNINNITVQRLNNSVSSDLNIMIGHAAAAVNCSPSYFADGNNIDSTLLSTNISSSHNNIHNTNNQIFSTTTITTTQCPPFENNSHDHLLSKDINSENNDRDEKEKQQEINIHSPRRQHINSRNIIDNNNGYSSSSSTSTINTMATAYVDADDYISPSPSPTMTNNDLFGVEQPPPFCEYKQELIDLKLCKICLDEIKNTVFIPCGHIATCLSCGKSLKKCPFCRDSISNLIQIFFV